MRRERLTEYHCGVPVIKDKRFGEAAAKLATLEDVDQNHPRVRELAEQLNEFLCDKLCLYRKFSSTQSALDDCCSMCKADKLLDEIVAAYTILNTFCGSEFKKTLKELQETKLQLKMAENAVELLKSENLQAVALGEPAELKKLEEYAAVQKELFPVAAASMIAGAADYAYYTGRISRDAWEDFNSVHVLNDNKK